MDKSEPIKMKNISRNPVGTFRPLEQSNQKQRRTRDEVARRRSAWRLLAWRGRGFPVFAALVSIMQ